MEEVYCSTDRISNQPQYSLKPNTNPEWVPNFVQLCEGWEREEATEGKFEVGRD